MDRVYNVEKTRKRARTGPNTAEDGTCTAKKRGRPKRSSDLESRYPLIQLRDDASAQQHVQAISVEMEREKPRKDILLPLMKSTFGVRRQYILSSDDCVFTKLDKYPALKMPALVC